MSTCKTAGHNPEPHILMMKRPMTTLPEELIPKDD